MMIELFFLNNLFHAGDETRVVLSTVPKVHGSDYINANYVDVSESQRSPETLTHTHTLSIARSSYHTVNVSPVF